MNRVRICTILCAMLFFKYFTNITSIFSMICLTTNALCTPSIHPNPCAPTGDRARAAARAWAPCRQHALCLAASTAGAPLRAADQQTRSFFHLRACCPLRSPSFLRLALRISSVSLFASPCLRISCQRSSCLFPFLPLYLFPHCPSPPGLKGARHWVRCQLCCSRQYSSPGTTSFNCFTYVFLGSHLW